MTNMMNPKCLKPGGFCPDWENEGCRPVRCPECGAMFCGQSPECPMCGWYLDKESEEAE